MKKQLIPLFLFSVLIGTSQTASAIDFGKFLSNIFATKAASKAVDDGGKDVEKFRTANCTGLNPWGQPYIADEKVMERSLFLCRTSYGVQYDSQYKTPLWVSEILDKNNIIQPPPDVKYSPIRPDPDLPHSMQVDLNDYLGTGYEPFPLAPLRDMFIYSPGMKEELALQRNQKSVDEASYASNTLPMVASLRTGLWQQLEIDIRVSLSKPSRQQVFVVTGPIYYNGQVNGYIGKGKNAVPIPTHYYKIVVDPDINGSQTYIIPNKNILTVGIPNRAKDLFTCGGGPCELSNFITPIQEAEKLTKFTFFPKLAPHYATKVKLDPNEINKKPIANLK